MLQAIDLLHKAGYRFTITSITTGSHSSASKHYQGRAVDLALNFSAKPQQTYPEFASALAGRGATLVQCEKNGVKVNCAGGPVDHVHAEFP